MKPGMLLATFALAVTSSVTLAHGDAKHQGTATSPQEQTPWGIAGHAGPTVRTVSIVMSDSMRFAPDDIPVKQGETVRFVLRNEGRMLHEMVIGTKTSLEEHAALMRRFPDMEHGEPYMAHVAKSESTEIVWHFNQAGEFSFACLIPGHYEAGMVGRITVRP